jgi:hypothetical protein
LNKAVEIENGVFGKNGFVPNGTFQIIENYEGTEHEWKADENYIEFDNDKFHCRKWSWITEE